MFKRNTDGVETRWRDGIWPELKWLEPPPASNTVVRRTTHCPKCKADINVRCTYARGRKLDDVHSARRKLYEEKRI